MDYKEIPRGHLSTIILSTLLDGDKYGYDIVKAVEEKTEGKITIKQPSLYSSLRRMEEQELISSYWRDSDIGGKRHYYRLTDIGKKQVEEWQKDLVESQNALKSVIKESPTYDKFMNISKTENAPEVPVEDVNVDNSSDIILQQANLFDLEKSTIKKEEQSADLNVYQVDMFDAKNVEKSEVLVKKENEEKSDERVEQSPAFNVRSELTKYIKERKSFSDSVKDVDMSFAPKINIVEKFEETHLELQPNNDEIDTEIDDEEIVETGVDNSDLNADIKNTEETVIKKDDAVFITEKTDPELLPKVKKIEPSIFEKLGVDSDLAHKLLNRQSYSTYSEQPNDVNDAPLAKTQEKTVSEDYLAYETDLSQLKDIYISKQGTVQQKTLKQQSISKISATNRANIFTTSVCCLLVILESILIYYTSDVINLKFMFYLIPILAFTPVIIYIFKLNNFSPKIDKGIKPYLVLQCISLIGVIIVFALNMIFGMDFNNISDYVETFTLPSIAILTLPIYKLLKFILYKNLR